jgi:DNA-binding transcriptional MerR regulator
MKRLEDYDDGNHNLIYRKVCIRGHCGPDGKNVKLEGFGCLACSRGYPNGPFAHLFTTAKEPKKGNVKYFTDEEKRVARVDQQVRWNKRNKEKVRAYVAKYDAKPENKERASVRRKKQWAEMDPKKKAELLQKRREYYLKKKEAKNDPKCQTSQSETTSGVGRE